MWENNNISWTSLDLERRETIFLKIGPFSDLFGQNWPKIRLQICPAAPLFIRPFLTYTAEQSASFVSATQAMADSAAWVTQVTAGVLVGNKYTNIVKIY